MLVTSQRLARLAPRISLLVVLVMAVALFAAPPALAHSAAGSPSSNYRTTLEQVSPKAEGFSVRPIEQGSRVEVRWLTGEPLVVLGYEDEPYLRIGPDGVEENRKSPATFINRDRQGTTAPPEDTNAGAEPVWVRVSDDAVARFHDHRAHYMGSVPPQEVEQNPKLRQTVQSFEIPIVQGSVRHVAAGIVEWIPSSSGTIYWLVALVLALALAAVAVWAGTNDGRRLTVRPLIIGALGLLVLVDVIHLFGIAGGVVGGSWIGRVVSIGYASIAAWLIAGLSAVLWLRGRPDALYLTTFAAGLMTLVGGIADLSILTKPSVVFMWSAGLARWCVALTLGLGVGLVLAAVLLTRPSATAQDPTPVVAPVG